ncbi:MAG: hypothetical protein HC874_27305 [Richelia sp. SL_2_1]|nr:hypothetical protein [Richelia sp. SL_2_1]
MATPTRYRTGAEGNLVNIDFAEFATGNGIITFEGLAGKSTGPVYTYHALPTGTSIFSQGNSDNKATVGTAFSSGSGLAKRFDIDFDATTNNYTTVIKGKAMVQFTYALVGGSGSTVTGYSVATVYRVRGGVETTIGTITGATDNSGAGTVKWVTETFVFDLTETVLNPGDTLRLNIELWGSCSSASLVGNFYLLHDPANRTFAGGSHDPTLNPAYMRWFIPFRVDV